MVFFPALNVVHTGDVFSNGRFPYIDLAAGGNAVRLREVIDFLLGSLKEGVKIIPGHGKLATLDDLRRYREMLVETTSAVEKQMKAGRTLVQIQRAGLDKRWQEWAHSFVPQEKWIEFLYRSLEQKRAH
jgi:glyoxylase-like metal-dependent hydrolase (beta-lactamase superfamily II)